MPSLTFHLSLFGNILLTHRIMFPTTPPPSPPDSTGVQELQCCLNCGCPFQRTSRRPQSPTTPLISSPQLLSMDGLREQIAAGRAAINAMPTEEGIQRMRSRSAELGELLPDRSRSTDLGETFEVQQRPVSPFSPLSLRTTGPGGVGGRRRMPCAA